ncbi:MAG: aspartate ammonia-lyase [Candidatus Marsarchaeota archaeon]|jgi:fumarate hydratase class II|nr:aspartate ammonia-lyase [Candidatus Marsarchaeota archaeon]
MKYRIEEDALGKVRIPSESYHGAETQRALDLFGISGIRVPADFIRSYVMIKRSAAMANFKAGKLDARRSRAIVKACDMLLRGRFMDQFPLDVFQAGAGTNTNMNVNEVIANIAIGILGGRKGDYDIVHPNDHVNMSQSTNDTYPSAINVSAYLAVTRKLAPQLAALRKSLSAKGREFADVVKIGRTHLQDAVPITLGEEFGAYAREVERALHLLDSSSKELLELSLGGTAVGTGINAGREYQSHVIKELDRITGVKFRVVRNKFAMTESRIDVMAVDDSLRETALVLIKIANDLRLLASGPRAGMHEILLPETMPGSSIMPGKVNPSVPEMLTMVCFEVIGLNAGITEAAENGQLELNVFMPLISYNTIFSIDILANALGVFRKSCINGIRADRASISKHLDENLSLATALNQYIGYEKAAKIARRALKENKTIKEVCLEMKILDRKTLDKILGPRREAGR